MMSVFVSESFGLSSLPYLSLADRRKLPSCPAVYFALSSQGRVLYVGRSANICERLRSHHRVPLLEALGGVKIAWLEQSNSFALPRLEKTLIKHFNPPLNRIPSSLKKEEAEKLIKDSSLIDNIPEMHINHKDEPTTAPSRKKTALLNQIQAESKLCSSFSYQRWTPSEFKEIILEQAKSIKYLEESLAELRMRFQEQMQTQRQLTEVLVEQAKAISELSRAQAENNNRHREQPESDSTF